MSNNTYLAFAKCVNIEHPNGEVTLATVKDGKEMDLIRLGCFSGHEKMFRCTRKSCYETVYTVWSGDELKAFTWTSATLVSDNVRQMAEFIQAMA
jgi:hypothetical protein